MSVYFLNSEMLATQVNSIVAKVYAHLKPKTVVNVQNDSYIANAQMCGELLDMRDGLSENACMFTAEDYCQLIEYLCTI